MARQTSLKLVIGIDRKDREWHWRNWVDVAMSDWGGDMVAGNSALASQHDSELASTLCSNQLGLAQRDGVLDIAVRVGLGFVWDLLRVSRCSKCLVPA